MGSNVATWESYGDVEVVLELSGDSGIRLRAPALKYKDALRMMRLRDLALQGSPSAVEEISDEFPKLVGLEDAPVTPMEMFLEVFPAFLSRHGTRRTIPTSPTSPTPSSSIMGSTT